MQAMADSEVREDVGGPLAGVRVLDMSRLLVGNVMTQVLADMGADVIKIEPSEEDSLRHWARDGVAVQWKVYSRNKRSVALDLNNDENRDFFCGLVETADILIKNFRPGVLDRLGFPASWLHALRVSLVIVSTSGWGQTGPYRNRPGFRTPIEAASSFAYKNGFPESTPLLPNLGLADSVVGLNAASAALAALCEIDARGAAGQEVDIPLLELLVSTLGADQALYKGTGKVSGRHANRTPIAAPHNLYETRDGRFVAITSSTQAMTEQLFRAIKREELITDPRSATNEKRVENVEELDVIISGFVREAILEEMLQFFESAEVTAGPIYNTLDLMENEHVKARRSIIAVPDDQRGTLPMYNLVPRCHSIERVAPRLSAAELRAEIAESAAWKRRDAQLSN